MDLSNLFSRQRFDSSERHVSFRYLSLTSKLNVLHRAAIKFYDFPRTFASPLFAWKGKKVRYSRRKNRFRAVNWRRFQNSIPGRLPDDCRSSGMEHAWRECARPLNIYSSLMRFFLISPRKGNYLLPTVPEFKSVASRCDIPDELKLEENVLGC